MKIKIKAIIIAIMALIHTINLLGWNLFHVGLRNLWISLIIIKGLGNFSYC